MLIPGCKIGQCKNNCSLCKEFKKCRTKYDVCCDIKQTRCKFFKCSKCNLKNKCLCYDTYFVHPPQLDEIKEETYEKINRSDDYNHNRTYINFILSKINKL